MGDLKNRKVVYSYKPKEKNVYLLKVYLKKIENGGCKDKSTTSEGK